MFIDFRNILTIGLIIATINLPVTLYSNNGIIGSRSASLGGCSVSLTDFWNIANNQAGIASFKDPAIGIFYQSNYLTNQISSKSIAGFMPTRFGVIGLTYNHFGYTLFNRQKAGIVYAKSFGDKLRIGLQLDYYLTHIANNYGSASNITFDLGLQYELNSYITIGAWVTNPIRTKLSDFDDERLPTIMKTGLTWHVSNNFITILEIEKNTIIQPLVLRGGAEYSINQSYFFRIGFSTYKEIFSFGTGIKIKHLYIDISAVMHESLGFTPQVSLIYHF